MPPCLTLSIIRYGSRVKWSNPGKGVAPSPTPSCGSYRKGNLRVTLDYGRQLYLGMHLVIFVLMNAKYLEKHFYRYKLLNLKRVSSIILKSWSEPIMEIEKANSLSYFEELPN